MGVRRLKEQASRRVKDSLLRQAADRALFDGNDGVLCMANAIAERKYKVSPADVEYLETYVNSPM